MTDAAAAADRPVVYTDEAQAIKLYPNDLQPIEHGVRLHLKNGLTLDVTENAFGKTPPRLCFYAPALRVAGFCQTGEDINMTLLVDMANGRRMNLPGAPTLTADPMLIAVGPAKGAFSDSLTLVRVTPTTISEEGWAQFDDNLGPGGWAGADCYRLKATSGPDQWLEKSAGGWTQVTVAQSKVCSKRHGR